MPLSNHPNELQERTKMKSTPKTLIAIMMMISIFCASGCGDGTSSTSNPAGPDIYQSDDLSALSSPDREGNMILGVYEFVEDPETNEISLVPKREAEWTFNISKFIDPWVYPDTYIQSTGYFWCDLTIENPTKDATVYDLRVIIVPHPGSDAHMYNAENYTAWFSQYEGMVNGFISYAKNVPNRAFYPGAKHTETLEFHNESGNSSCMTDCDVVIACSAPGNCEDPYEITDIIVQSSIYETSDTPIEMNILCHSGSPVRVWVESASVTGEDVFLENPEGNHWVGILRNNMGAAQGDYRFKIVADAYYGSEQGYTGATLYDFVDVWVD